MTVIEQKIEEVYQFLLDTTEYGKETDSGKRTLKRLLTEISQATTDHYRKEINTLFFNTENNFKK